MTVNEILDDAKELYHEFTKATNAARTEIADIQWVRWLNEWQEETAIISKNPRQEALATTDSGRNYDVPSDFLVMVSLKLKVNGGNYERLKFVPFDLMPVEFGETWEDAAAGVPTAFTFPTQDTFYLNPPPNAANQGTDFLLMNYVYRPTALSARSLGASPAINGAYHRSAKYFLGYRAHNFLGNPRIAQEMYERWLQSVKGRDVARKDTIESKVKTVKRMRWG